MLRSALACSILALVCGCAQTNPAPPPQPIAARVDSLFASFDSRDSPGCAVGVYRGGELVLARGYGMADIEGGVPVTPQTVFDVASNSKQFTALAVLLLERRGHLALDDRVRPLVPELPKHGDPITIRHLLNNTSGLRDLGDLLELRGQGIERPIDLEQAMELLSRQERLNFVAGERYQYSNTNWILLALVVERVSGQRFRDFMKVEVFARLGMHRTEVRDDWTRPIRGAARSYTPMGDSGYRVNHAWGRASGLGGMSFIHTTVEDLALWDRNFYQENVGGAGIVARMYERGRLNSGDTIFYASGLMLGRQLGLRSVFHGGHGGGSSELIRFPERKLSVAVLCNQYHTHTDARGLALEVAALFLGDTMNSTADSEGQRRPRAFQDVRNVLMDYAGLYWIPEQARRAEFVVRNGILLEVSDGEEYPLEALGEGRFQDEWESVAFDDDGTGGRGVHRPTAEEYTLIRWPDSYTPENPEEYLGDFFSAELDASWTIRLFEGRLVLARDGATDVQLRPALHDVFMIPGTLIEFHRTVSGEVDSLEVSTARVDGLRFARVRAEAE